MIDIYQVGQVFVKTLSNALDVADKWMHEAFNETSREMSEQAKDGSGNKCCQPDTNGHAEVKCGIVELAAAKMGETSQFVNKIDDNTSMEMMTTRTPEVNVDAASLTQDDHWEEIDGDPPSLMPGVNMDNVPDRTQDFVPAC